MSEEKACPVLSLYFLLSLLMTTIIERDVSSGNNDSSAMTALFAIIAIVVVVGLLYVGLRSNAFNTGTSSTPKAIDVNVNGNLPTNPAAPSNP